MEQTLSYVTCTIMLYVCMPVPHNIIAMTLSRQICYNKFITHALVCERFVKCCKIIRCELLSLYPEQSECFNNYCEQEVPFSICTCIMQYLPIIAVMYYNPLYTVATRAVCRLALFPGFPPFVRNYCITFKFASNCAQGGNLGKSLCVDYGSVSGSEFIVIIIILCKKDN